MGAVVNQRPDLFAAVVARCLRRRPHDDPRRVASDGDRVGRGDPRRLEFYELLKSYSPYDNVEPKDYPPMLVTAGLNDPRVAYWEPARVAKLRRRRPTTTGLL